MFMVGQLSEKINPFWELEFVGYHGLRSVNDIPKNSLKYVCCQRLSRSELGHYYSLLRNVTPIVRHPICFPFPLLRSQEYTTHEMFDKFQAAAKFKM